MIYFPKTMTSNYHWVPCTTKDKIPSGAVQGGTDIDGRKIYVGRSHFKNELIPTKVIFERKEAYLSHGGKVHSVKFVEVLCQKKFVWVRASNGNVTKDAVEGGRAENGELLYIGRAKIGKDYIVGKIHPSYFVLFIPFGGKEKSFKEYEVLCAF